MLIMLHKGKGEEKNMKRMISCLLAVILALAPCLQADALGLDEVDIQVSEDAWADTGETAGSEEEGRSAAVNGSEMLDPGELAGEDVQEVPSDGNDSSISGSETPIIGGQAPDGRSDKAQIDVVITSALDLKEPVEFKVTVDGAEPQTVTLGGTSQTETAQKAEREIVVFEGLSPQKTYMLKVEAPGFAAYTREIVIEDPLAYRLQLMTGDVKVPDGTNSNWDVLRIGDVNGDGEIDEQDKDRLITVIDEKKKDDQTDLNRDGKTDLADLEYFSKSYETEAVESIIEKYVPANRVNVSHDDEKIQVDGDINALFTSQGGEVSVSPVKDGAITPENPVQVDFDLDAEINRILIETDPVEPVMEADFTILYVDDSGQEQRAKYHYDRAQVSEGVHYLLKDSRAVELGVSAIKNEDGTICLDLGRQVPVKKVTFKITGVGAEKNNDLAKISKVEFIGDFAERIPEPQMDIPQNVCVENNSQAFTVTWDSCVNVTGYEVWVQEKGSEAEPYIAQVTGNTLKVTSIGAGKAGKLVNGKVYLVKVRSVNGTWRSPYSDEVTAEPKSTKAPAAPDNLSLTGKYKEIAASWKDMDDTLSYDLYYKKVDGDTEYTVIPDIETNSYKIKDLEELVMYEVYVIGKNSVGQSAPSLKRQVQTTDLNPAKMPKYKRINAADEGEKSEHIINATASGGSWQMKDSPLDTESGTIWGTVDNNPSSYYRVASWDLGGYNNNNNGLIYEFDQAYEIQDIALQSTEAEYTDFTYANIRYWDADGKAFTYPRGTFIFQTKQDENNKPYYWIRLPKVVTAKKIKIGLGRYLATEAYNLITVSEVNFYHYDSLADDISALYQDDLHTVLKDDVTQETIDKIRQRINTVDPVSGEYHPEKELLERELKTAEDILNAVDLSSPVSIHRSITTKDTGRGFSGLNGWQPLGITAAGGEKLNVYVGHASMKTGESTNLSLVATQYHSESGGVVTYTSQNLTIGRNEITLSKPSSPVAGCETGGALYVQYSGGSANDDYAVRVDGGTPIPVLDLYHVTDKTERQQRTETYVAQLIEYESKMQETHEKVHKGFSYDEKNCILGAADILLDTMMLSIPAQQIFKGSGSGTTEQKAQKILTSMDAMEEMMNLFYQHKGLNAKAEKEIDQIPKTHLNIRYQRMFAGAFMYAGGNHIGIEYDSTSGMVSGVPVQKDENGKWISGQYFGWGIAHEIGHNINQGTYAVAEITNNYFAVLAQAKDNNDSVRFQYKNVYEKVSSGTKGNASNVFTQLAMYWQLHLAYDNGYNYKTYDDHAEQLENLFFARVDTYARTPGNAPKPGGVALTLDGGGDQCLMRLACAATQKNILEFFEHWGKTPDEKTIAYAAQFEKETRAIWYANDDARVYRLTNSGSSLSTNSTTQAVGDKTTATVNETAKNQVDFTFDSKISEDDLLGYEVTRCIRSNGNVEEQVVGFANQYNNFSFSDHVTTMNNRVVTYKVTVIDKYLNRSAAKELDPVKIEHKGNIDKTNWTVESSGISTNQVIKAEGEEIEESCKPEVIDPIVQVIDNKKDTTYVGKVDGTAEVILRLNQIQTVAALEYSVTSGTPIQNYSISILEESGKWKEVKNGTFGNGSSQTVYFDNENKVEGNIGSYSTEAVKLSILDAKETEFAISELDVLGVTGDNVDFRRENNTGEAVIGRLEADYTYKDGESTGTIPKGSIVFTGSYEGNPAYNVVILYDKKGNIVGGTKTEENGEESLNSHQMIFAEVPNTGNIQDVSDGTWVYWIEPDEKINLSALEEVRAELYRVDDALTNKGQRLVSDSYFEKVPAETELPSITIGKTGQEQ